MTDPINKIKRSNNDPNKPFFTAEDFGCHCPGPEKNPLPVEHPGHYDWCEAIESADISNAKVAPLIAENERLKDENRKILKELNATTQGRENAYKEQEQLTEQNRELESIVSKRVPKLEKILSIMKEALEYISRATYGTEPCNTDEENNEILARHFFRHQNHAREALAKVKELEK